MPRRRRVVPALGAIIVALVVVGGAAAASIPDGAGVFHACYNKFNGALRLISNTSTCATNEVAVQWNQAGPTGPPGPAGPQGPAGSQGPAGPSDDAFSVASGNGMTLAPPGNDVGVHLDLPQGKYAVSATVVLLNSSGASDVIACSIGDTNGGSSQTSYASVPTGGWTTLPLQYTATFPYNFAGFGGTVTIGCGPTDPSRIDALGNPVGYDEQTVNSSIDAVRVATINGN